MNNIATPARVALTESGWYGRLMHSVVRRPLILFFFLAYVWSWTVWLIVPRIIHRRGLDVNHGNNVDLLVLILGTFGPTIAALITRRITCLDLKICPVWTGWRKSGELVIYSAQLKL